VLRRLEELFSCGYNETVFKGKTVLVTGGTGTFGRAFVRRMLQEPVKKLIILSRDELKQYEMQRSGEFNDERLRYFLGDIRDLRRLERAFEGVDIVVHAAALKQVPATEYNPSEAIKTNVDGSQNVVDAALSCGVEKTILISSDKAVSPVNLYGATKMCAERLFIAANAYRGDKRTAFSVIRYGNVIGSRGSFIDLLNSQKKTGKVTLTHESMTRFWIRIDDVMEVVLSSLARMQGGELFVPKMKNLSIVDVVKIVASEAIVEIVGMRPGEKLHEVLLTEHEIRRTKDAGDSYVVRPEFVASDLAWLDELPEVPNDLILSSDNRAFRLSDDEARVLF
jgi:UDP-N-acetylglucosamine 4,6-dehydratase